MAVTHGEDRGSTAGDARLVGLQRVTVAVGAQEELRGTRLSWWFKRHDVWLANFHLMHIDTCEKLHIYEWDRFWIHRHILRSRCGGV